ncbi:MAG: hypothetical protein EPN31_12115 [Castellaniella sp.]|uniref:hypothetical protein n=1 Tax=Castellaniella sp. TaxID=1955812 RepID=UPI0012103536|nr:hypothetical protein [Castellaniella sp.]TAN27273.1 MAG: hypothetical protein EPN31_12115 [Castellaniella sp.]
MFFAFLIAMVGVFVVVVGFGVAFSRQYTTQTTGQVVDVSSNATVGKSLRKAGLSIVFVGAAILVGDWVWYQFSYMSQDRVTTRQVAQAKNQIDMNEIKLQRLVRSYVSAMMKDPGSSEFRNQYGVCGEVNAKNSFGAYTGYRRFVAKSERMVFLEGNSALSAADFGTLWAEACGTSPTGAERR